MRIFIIRGMVNFYRFFFAIYLQRNGDDSQSLYRHKSAE